MTPNSVPAAQRTAVREQTCPLAPAVASSPGDERELNSLLGEGTSSSALNGIELELYGLRGVRSTGRVAGLAPLDLLGEFRDPIPAGELVCVQLSSHLLSVPINTFGLVHWQRQYYGRWLAGMFLRERLPAELLEHVWMDMRRELRFPSQLPLRVRFRGQSRCHEAVVCDYSRSGARLETHSSVVSGPQVQLFDGDLIATGHIRYTRPARDPSRACVGCEFTENEGVRLARLAVLQTDAPPCNWRMAEEWQGERVR